jgi:hypothetical protein
VVVGGELGCGTGWLPMGGRAIRRDDLLRRNLSPNRFNPYDGASFSGMDGD